MFPFEIDEESDVPIWVQLRQRIAYLINSGYFKAGDKLPTVRGLASEISINYNTVNKAYISLVSDGYLESTRGRGVFVTDVASKFDGDDLGKVDSLIDEFVTSCHELGMSYEDIEKAVSRRIKKRYFEDMHADPEAVPGGRIIEFESGRITNGPNTASAVSGA